MAETLGMIQALAVGGDVEIELLRPRLGELLESIPNDSPFRSRYRERLEGLIAIVESEGIGDEAREAARMCRGPVPLPSEVVHTTNSDPEPRPGPYASARAMAVGGAKTDRYLFEPGRTGDWAWAAIQAAIAALVATPGISIAFVIDRHGQLLAAGGDTDSVETTSLASVVAGGADQVLAQLKQTGRSRISADRRYVHMRLLERALVMTVITAPVSEEREVEAAMDEAAPKLIEVVDGLLAQVGSPSLSDLEITDEDLDSLFLA